MRREHGRFAPSSTGHAHPGTLLAALLCWLDARSRGARVSLRLEDLDPERARASYSRALRDELAWLGLDWDGVEEQHANAQRHEAALDALAEAGLLYACGCSRAELRKLGRRAPDGGFAYDNRCRHRTVSPRRWREVAEPLRVRLPDERVDLVDESGLSLSQVPALEMGDPVVRRRDGAVAYQLAVVVDDAHAGITRIVRGRDIAASTATQVCLQRYLGMPTPSYRHHLLLLEPRGDKLAKLHGSVSLPALRERYSPEALVGFLAHVAGLRESPTPVTARRLITEFDWQRVRTEDVVVVWDGDALRARRE